LKIPCCWPRKASLRDAQAQVVLDEANCSQLPK
jgi:hypothetical protein